MENFETTEIETTPESDGSEFEPSTEAVELDTQELEVTPDPEDDEETDNITTSTEDPQLSEDEEINNAATPSQDELNTDEYYDLLDEDDLDGPSDDFNPDREYTDEDIKQLEEEDEGYINGDVLDYDHPDYINEGIHRIKWSEDSTDTPHRETLEPGTRLSRVGNENGRYLGDENVAYDDRQLPIYEGKQPIHQYEVLKPLDVEQSTIAQQDWGPEMKNPDAQQYKTDKTIAELINQGYLREIPAEGSDGVTSEQGRNLRSIDDL